MDRRERIDDPVEATRAALDGRQSEIWTALPGIIQSFDPIALTVTVQVTVQGSITAPDGSVSRVNLPVLPDVPVAFPHGGGFSLTYPLKGGDEVLVIFASRCIDAWWQSGGVQPPAEQRMHDLSDGIAIPGPWSQARKLVPPADTENVQLRTDDGKAHLTMMPDYTIRAQNPQASVELTPGGDVTLQGSGTITLDAPQIVLKGNITTMGQSGPGTVSMKGDISLQGSLTSSGDQVAGGISQTGHTHVGCQGGSTGGPQ